MTIFLFPFFKAKQTVWGTWRVWGKLINRSASWHPCCCCRLWTALRRRIGLSNNPDTRRNLGEAPSNSTRHHVLSTPPHAFSALQPPCHGVPERLWSSKIWGEIWHSSTPPVMRLSQSWHQSRPLQLSVHQPPPAGLQLELQSLQLAATFTDAQRCPPTTFRLFLPLLIILLHLLPPFHFQQLHVWHRLWLPGDCGGKSSSWRPSGSHPCLLGGPDLVGCSATAVWRWDGRPRLFARSLGRGARQRGQREGAGQQFPGLWGCCGGFAQLCCCSGQLTGNNYACDLFIFTTCPRLAVSIFFLISSTVSRSFPKFELQPGRLQQRQRRRHLLRQGSRHVPSPACFSVISPPVTVQRHSHVSSLPTAPQPPGPPSSPPAPSSASSTPPHAWQPSPSSPPSQPGTHKFRSLVKASWWGRCSTIKRINSCQNKITSHNHTNFPYSCNGPLKGLFLWLVEF